MGEGGAQLGVARRHLYIGLGLLAVLGLVMLVEGPLSMLLLFDLDSPSYHHVHHHHLCHMLSSTLALSSWWWLSLLISLLLSREAFSVPWARSLFQSPLILLLCVASLTAYLIFSSQDERTHMAALSSANGAVLLVIALSSSSIVRHSVARGPRVLFLSCFAHASLAALMAWSNMWHQALLATLSWIPFSWGLIRVHFALQEQKIL